MPTRLAEQAPQPAPQAVKRKKRKKGKKEEKVGPAKPVGTRLEGMCQQAKSHNFGL